MTDNTQELDEIAQLLGIYLEEIDVDGYMPITVNRQTLAHILDWHNKHTLEARISTLKKLKNTRTNAELDDQTSDYLRGYREMEAKIGFELNRLNKLKESTDE